MPKLPRWSGAEVIRRLKELGYIQIRQRGSHVVLKKQPPTGELGCVVPLHQELAIGTLHGILKQAQVSVTEFLNLR